MSELKSSYEKALEKMEKMGMDDTKKLTEEQKKRVAEIKKNYEAKIAEKKILLSGSPELPDEIKTLERKRDDEIEKLYQ